MKAVSPLVATILLIGMVVVAFAIIYAWSKGFISEELEKFGEPIDVACHKVAFDVQVSAKGEGIYELVISNRGNIGINEINIKATQGGKSIIKALPLSPEGGLIEKGGTAVISFDLKKFGFDFFDTIDVTPVLLGKVSKGKNVGITKLYLCKEEAKKGLRAEFAQY